MFHQKRRADGQRGQIVILFALVLVLLMALGGLVIDVGFLRADSQRLWNSLDAGALAGAEQLATSPTTAGATALNLVQVNYSGLPAGAVIVSFRCLIGSLGTTPRLTDMPGACSVPSAGPWTCNTSVCTAPCDPTTASKCNTTVVSGSATQQYLLAPAVGIRSGNAGTHVSAACMGPCGAPPSNPVDLVLIIDRTGSMSGVDTANARAAADSIRTMYDPTRQWMALGLLGPSSATTACSGASSPARALPDSSIGTANTPGDVSRWVPVGLSGIGAPVNENYTTSTSTLAKAITCYTNSGTGTDLADPIAMAQYVLVHDGRTGVRKGIILETDGQPNAAPASGSLYTGSLNCNNTSLAATAAKAAGIEIFTIGFGLDGSNNATCPDGSGAWQGKTARALLASVATQPSVDGGCPGTSNTDGDHFFCIPKSTGASTDLTSIFQIAATSLAGGSTRLIALP